MGSDGKGEAPAGWLVPSVGSDVWHRRARRGGGRGHRVRRRYRRARARPARFGADGTGDSLSAGSGDLLRDDVHRERAMRACFSSRLLRELHRPTTSMLRRARPRTGPSSRPTTAMFMAASGEASGLWRGSPLSAVLAAPRLLDRAGLGRSARRRRDHDFGKGLFGRRDPLHRRPAGADLRCRAFGDHDVDTGSLSGHSERCPGDEPGRGGSTDTGLVRAPGHPAGGSVPRRRGEGRPAPHRGGGWRAFSAATIRDARRSPLSW